ncbi:MAG TPA: dihydrodipicolinate synthase family protein [Terriglobia bacterium]|nr:dihydrodipicolinate synthase family protein [Terriglobia bacterium]
MLHPIELKERLRGVIVFAPTPFCRQDKEIDFAGFRSNLDYLIQNGIPSIAIAGFAGEYSALTPREYSDLVKAAADVVGGKANLIAGAGGGMHLACAAARAAQEGGADCVMTLPPYLVTPSPAGLLEHFRAVAESIQIALMIHSMPGSVLTPDLVQSLSETPNVIAYKDESGDLRTFDEVVHRVGERLLYVNGKAEMMMSCYFVAGATSNASAIGNFDPSLALAAFQAALAGDYRRVDELLLPKARPWYRLREKSASYLIPVAKASMELAGLCGGTVRPPLSDISPEDQKNLEVLMDKLGYRRSRQIPKGKMQTSLKKGI